MSNARDKVSPGPPSATFRTVAIGLLLLAVALVYADSLHGAFVFDDVPAILENPTLRHPGDLGSVLAPPGDQAGTVGGRPLLNLSLAVNYALGGPEPWGYHLVNLFVHAGAALVLFGLLRRTLQRRGNPAPAGSASAGSVGRTPWTSPWTDNDAVLLAFFAALLWAVHPLQTEAVTYVVQRAESLMGLFYFLTLYCFVRSTDRDFTPEAARGARPDGTTGGLFWSVLSVLACLGGMATKEVMVSAPLVVLLYDRTFVAGSVRAAWNRRRGYYIGLAATWLLLLALVVSTHGRGGSAGFEASAGIWPYALTQARAVVRYLRLAFWPDDLVFDYGTGLVRHPAEVAGQLLFLGLLLAGTGYALFRRPAVGFLGFCFFAVLSPTSSVVPIATEPLAEHRMYLPLATISIFVVMTAFAVLQRFSLRTGRIGLCVLGAVAVAALGTATATRNRDYHTEVALWADTVKKMPENPRAHNNLAEAYIAAGQTAGVAAEFAAAIAADPTYAPAQYNLGVLLLDSNHAREAIPHLEQALSAPRHQAELQLYLGEANERTGRPAEAVDHYRKAVALDPQNAEAAFGLGNNLAAEGDIAAAVGPLRRAVALAPGQVRMRNNLANALLFSGRTDEAVAEYRRALQLAPDNASIRENLERALAQSQGGRNP